MREDVRKAVFDILNPYAHKPITRSLFNTCDRELTMAISRLDSPPFVQLGLMSSLAVVVRVDGIVYQYLAPIFGSPSLELLEET